LQVVCAWTKRINLEGRWVALDEFLTNNLNTQITYGVSPEAMQEVLNREKAEARWRLRPLLRLVPGFF
jgi:hypothetical protein